MRKLAKITIGAVAAISLISILGGDSDSVDQTNPTVQRISALSDCAQLQEEFDIADDNHRMNLDRDRIDLAKLSTDYMQVADERMREIGCY